MVDHNLEICLKLHAAVVRTTDTKCNRKASSMLDPDEHDPVLFLAQTQI